MFADRIHFFLETETPLTKRLSSSRLFRHCFLSAATKFFCLSFFALPFYESLQIYIIYYWEREFHSSVGRLPTRNSKRSMWSGLTFSVSGAVAWVFPSILSFPFNSLIRRVHKYCAWLDILLVFIPTLSHNTYRLPTLFYYHIHTPCFRFMWWYFHERVAILFSLEKANWTPPVKKESWLSSLNSPY